MEKLITIYNTEYAIPAVFSYSPKYEKMPAVILCHGTGSQKNEVGNLFTAPFIRNANSSGGSCIPLFIHSSIPRLKE